MLGFAATLGLWVLAVANAEESYKQCPGHYKHVDVPSSGYNFEVPDAHFTGDVTEVRLNYDISKLKQVKEDR